MSRSANATITIDVASPSDLVFSVAIAAGSAERADESLVVSLDGRPVETSEVTDSQGSRLHRVHAQPGRLVVNYDVALHADADTEPVREVDLITFLRPSRYCESDQLQPTAVAEFAGVAQEDLLAAVSSWVGTRLSYVPGSSLPTDGAVRTLLARQGVCRDYAHLAIALLRALEVPARLVSVYAPGLDPMDFHAVAEAYVAGAWHVVDPTTLAPRQTMMRIATGRDAADTAFMSGYGGRFALVDVKVGAVADVLPRDDVRNVVALR